jgi:hypothetical protein
MTTLSFSRYCNSPFPGASIIRVVLSKVLLFGVCWCDGPHNIRCTGQRWWFPRRVHAHLHLGHLLEVGPTEEDFAVAGALHRHGDDVFGAIAKNAGARVEDTHNRDHQGFPFLWNETL